MQTNHPISAIHYHYLNLIRGVVKNGNSLSLRYPPLLSYSMGILDFIKEKKDLWFYKDIRTFNAGQLTPNDDLPRLPTWFFQSQRGWPRGINFIELRQYAKSAWVQMVVNTIIKQMQLTEWVIVPKSEDDATDFSEDIERATTFLKIPNRNQQTFDEVFGQYLRDLLELDAGVLFKGRAEGKLVELFAHDGARFLRDVDASGIYKGWYQYSFTHSASAPKFFETEDIIYGMMNLSTETFPYGFSPLQSIQQVVELMIQADRYNKEFFRNNAIPDGIITTDMPADQLQRFSREWKQQVQGQAHKLMFLNSSKAEFTPLAMNNKDMEWLEGQKWYFHLIFASYGLSPQEAGFYEDSNRSTSESQERISARNAIQPYLDKIASDINCHILPDLLEHDELKFKWMIKDATKEQNEHTQMMEKLKANVLTVNEVRRVEGLEDVEWGDKPVEQPSPFGFMGGQTPEPGKQEPKREKEPDSGRELYKRLFIAHMKKREDHGAIHG